jgi:hypothetical protein
MNDEYIIWKEDQEGESVKKDRFPLCEPAHQFAWLKHQKKLVFILKLYEEKDGLKIEYAEVYQDTAESRKRIPIEEFQKPTPDQILQAKPQNFGNKKTHKKRGRKRRKLNSDVDADNQFIEEYREFLKKLGIHESDEIDEQYLFDPEKQINKPENCPCEFDPRATRDAHAAVNTLPSPMTTTEVLQLTPKKSAKKRPAPTTELGSAKDPDSRPASRASMASGSQRASTPNTEGKKRKSDDKAILKKIVRIRS